MPTPARRSQRQRTQAGFTLAELMVSMLGTIIVTGAVFTFARNTTRVYQGETSTSNAILGNIMGFERLRSDLTRAGHMSSPNIRRDPFVCGDPVAGNNWPDEMERMASVRIADENVDGLPWEGLFNDNGLEPQRITISGNFLTSESMPVKVINLVGAEVQVELQANTGAIARLGYYETGANQAAILSTIFPPGRAARIVDDSGKHHYGQITGTTTVGGPTVLLSSNAPALENEDGGALGCGLNFGDNTIIATTINPVQFIRYRIGSLLAGEDNPYAPVYVTDDSEMEPWAKNAIRTELIREELDVDGDPIDGTVELVAEYAMDLHFGLTVSPSPEQDLVYVPTQSVLGWAGDQSVPEETTEGQGPQLVRTVHATLTIRNRTPDRQSGIALTAEQVAVNSPAHRVGLGDGATAPFARMMSAQARVVLENQLGVNWE